MVLELDQSVLWSGLMASYDNARYDSKHITQDIAEIDH